jgi:hypothetical protein
MVSRVPRRDFLPGGTDLVRLTLEPFVPDRFSRAVPVPARAALRDPGTYVACIVSFAGSYRSALFHRRSVTEAIFLARVSLAMSGETPRATLAS